MAKFSGYIGTYTEDGAKSNGIYWFSMNPETGVIENIRLAAEAKNPSFLALSPSGEFLYAVNEVDAYDGIPGGAVSAYAIRKDGTLKLLNRKDSKGGAPCHIAVDRNGTFAITANYSTGVLTVLPIGKRGSLREAVQVIQYKGSGPNKKRQERAHAHSFTFAPDFSGGFACDLGSDRLMLYHFNPRVKKPLIPREQPFIPALAGYGPRHGAFHPSGRFAYVLHELRSAVDVFAVTGGDLPAASGGNPKGGVSGRRRRAKNSVPAFERLQTISTLPGKGNRKPSTAAAIRIAPEAKFLYTSNRGYDSIAAFKILPEGLLELVDVTDSGGKHPRDFILDPGGNFLLALNKDSDNLVIFRIDPRTGLPKKEREYAVPSPAGIVFR
ncbi:MAG: lactonase family protein [Treponema sp.]|jgi:6-phosphogluconolactonase|nr:lactonase family protein [Treponema sp.]